MSGKGGGQQCPFCGADVEDGFCEECGEDVDEDDDDD